MRGTSQGMSRPIHKVTDLINLNAACSFAFLEGKAFRHGDIVSLSTTITCGFLLRAICPHTSPTQEDALGDVAKKAGGFALGALIGKGGSKFGGLDIKRVYFG